METFLPSACVPPVLVLSGSGNEDGALTVCWSVRGETMTGVLRKDAHSVTVQLSPCPVLLEAVERRGCAGCGRLWPASVQLLSRLHPAPVERVASTEVSDEMRYYQKPGDYCEAPCFLPRSADGITRDESPKAEWLRGVEGACVVGKEKTTLFPAAGVLVKAWQEYVKARGEEKRREEIKIKVASTEVSIHMVRAY